MATAAAAASPGEFATSRQIYTRPAETTQLAGVRLDASILAQTRLGFPDLRLVDGDGQEVPRHITPLYTSQLHTQRHALSSRVVELRELPGNRILTRLRLEGDSDSAAGFDIRTPLRDFIRTVRVEGSHDNRTWKCLVEDAEIYDYTRYIDLRHTEVAIPSNSYRYFSIEISDASEERAQPLIRLVRQEGRDTRRAYDLLQTPFRIDGISFWRETTAMRRDQLVEQDWPTETLTVADDPQARTTTVTLQTGRAPITRLILESPDLNFQRRATVLAPTVSPSGLQWQELATATLTRIHLDGHRRNDVEIQFRETRAEELRLVLNNGDSPPLRVTGIQARGPSYRLLWLAEPGIDYRLLYGHERLPAPDYDVFAIHSALERGTQPESKEMGAPAANPDVHRPFHLGEFLARPVVFGSLLALGAATLGGLLLHAMRRAGQTDSGRGAPPPTA